MCSVHIYIYIYIYIYEDIENIVKKEKEEISHELEITDL